MSQDKILTTFFEQKRPQLPQLPIEDIFEPLRQAFIQYHQVVVEAPPGAGKTTMLPLEMLRQPWLAGQRIIMLEPRRLAARSAAIRMASLLGEPVGQTVGYRVRQDTKVSQHTRIEVMTEGILTNMLIQDPALEGVGLLIFDEFHERSVEADLGLALTLEAREIFRDADNSLRLLVMSATLDGEAIASLLAQPDATALSLRHTPIIRSAGKQFPVTVSYSHAARYDDDIVERVVTTLLDAILDKTGSILVFLPGQAEIHRVLTQLKHRLPAASSASHIVLPLYGSLPLAAQQKAIEPLEGADKDLYKIVLSTDIAETSLTIEGITLVIDTGLCREPRFDAATGMTRLQTCRISKNASEQRKGRAGRLQAGHCYRLWSQEQQGQLQQQATAQILQADLAPLLLQLLAWGVDDIAELRWLDQPPAGHIAQALDLLLQLGAIEAKHGGDMAAEIISLGSCKLSQYGEWMATIPAHPRLAHMMICGASLQQSKPATFLAALLVERNPLGRDYGTDLNDHLALLNGTLPCPKQHQAWLNRSRKQAQSFAQFIKAIAIPAQHAGSDDLGVVELDKHDLPGYLLACAYPDRIARLKQNSSTQYQLTNGRSALLNDADSLAGQSWLVVAELGGTINRGVKRASDRIFSAVSFNPALFETHLSSLVQTRHSADWDELNQRFTAEKTHTVGKLTLLRQPSNAISPEQKQTALISLLRKKNLTPLPWDKSIRQWQARCLLLRNLQTTAADSQSGNTQDNPDTCWPDVSDEHLASTLEQWLGPFLAPINTLKDFQRLDLQSILTQLLPWHLSQQLQQLAPTSITVPSGSKVNIDYSQNPPVLRVKLQEMFGCKTTPGIANGNIKLQLHLLSPAQRPLQITQDLEGFWNNSYAHVKKDMKGRYPKHPWPDDPINTAPTKLTTRKLQHKV